MKVIGQKAISKRLRYRPDVFQIFPNEKVIIAWIVENPFSVISSVVYVIEFITAERGF
jgi:hypothetical protein